MTGKKGIVITVVVATSFFYLITHTDPFTDFFTKTLPDWGKTMKFGFNALGEEINNKIITPIDKVGDAAKNIFANMFNTPSKPAFCQYTFENPLPRIIIPTIDDPAVQKQDTENLIPYIQKYSPVLYLDVNEYYFPITAQEYFMGPWSAIKIRGRDNFAIPPGQVTFEKMYNLYLTYLSNPHGLEVYVDIPACVTVGSNPRNYTNFDGNLTTPAWVTTWTQNNKIYIQYAYFYGFNGPYDLFILRGDVFDEQNAHESDLEHMTIECNATTKNIERIYYGSHSGTEGFWFNVHDTTIKWEGTHPIVYVAHFGHGHYPEEGTYVRVFGLANDVTTRGMKWTPQLIRLYPRTDPRFDPKTMGFMYIHGSLGRRGVGPLAIQGWFQNVKGDEGRPYARNKWFCKNPPHPSGNVLDQIKQGFESIPGYLEYSTCVGKALPFATPPK